jgi:hypothetical protein
MQKLIVLVLFFSMLVGQASADNAIPARQTLTSSRVISVQGKNLLIPNPEYSVAASEKAPAMLSIFKEFYPEGTVIYEVYANEKNIEELISGETAILNQYFVVLQTPETSGQTYTKKQFSEIVAYLKKSHDLITGKDVTDKINNQVDKANRSIRERTGEKVDLAVSNLGFLGVSRVTDRSAMFSIRAILDDKVKNEKDSVVNSSVFVLLDNKIMLFAAYAIEEKDHAPDTALNWTKAQVHDWTKHILNVNPDSVEAQ